jgi:hypothetical protein
MAVARHDTSNAMTRTYVSAAEMDPLTLTAPDMQHVMAEPRAVAVRGME